MDIYDRREAMRASADPAERVVERLWADATDRRGWRQAADNFDGAVMHEILDRWLEIVRSADA